MKRFREGLVCKAHELLYHSTLGSRVIEKKKNLAVAVFLLLFLQLLPRVPLLGERGMGGGSDFVLWGEGSGFRVDGLGFE